MSGTLDDLVSYIIQPVQNDDVGRVRAVYRWITAQDLTKLKPGGGAGSGGQLSTPMDYLVGMKAKTVSYHRLFMDMCK